MSAIWMMCRLLLVAVFFLSSGCATTKLLSVWRDPEFTGTPRNIMVIGVMSNLVLKTQFEDEFVKQLKARGIDAVAGSSQLPADTTLDKDVIAAKMKDIGADTVLITRVIDRRTIESMASSAPGPPSRGQWYVIYSTSVAGMTSSLMAATQTNIYDLKTERLIWTAVSDTWIQGSEDNLFIIRTFVPVIIKRLVDEKVIK
jgi:hypothetical protein